jgi:hypothetical protein
MLDSYDVFISYSHLDSEWVKDWLLPRVEAAGLSVCIDFRDFDVGIPSLTNMENAAERSRKTLLVLTPNWIASEWTNFESLLIQTEDPSGVRQRTLPLMLKKCALPKRLGILTYADLTEEKQWDAQLSRVLVVITGMPVTRASVRSTPQPNLVHPYPLQANFTGRVREREELTAWLSNEEYPIYELVAMGGMGKSALTWYWIKNDVLSVDDIKLDGVMWWSFQDAESSFPRFVDEALKYSAGKPFDAERLPTTYDRAQELRQQLQTKRVLFVLDGFEWQLRAHARLDAVYQQDARDQTSSEARACVDPNAGRLLPYLASGPTRAKVVLTTRLRVSNLEDSAGTPLVGVFQRELTGLPRDDTVKFMRDQGVRKGTDTETATVCAAYGNHPLSLRLLSGLIERDAKMAGDIAAAPRVAARADFVDAHRQILERSYDALPEKESMLLSRIAAFRNPMAYDALTIFDDFGDDANFDATLEDLQARGLLQRDTKNNRYDLHPIVRHYAYHRLTDKSNVHIRLHDYFAKIPAPDTDQVKNLDDLAPVIELYHHTVSAGRYDEAVTLYYRRIWNALYYRLGAYQSEIELLKTLFPDGEDQLPRLQSETLQAWTANELGNSYAQSGQPRRAARLIALHNAVNDKPGHELNFAIGLQNVALGAQLALGEIEKAEMNLRRSIEVCRELNDKYWEAVGHEGLGLLLTYRGLAEAGEAELALAQDVFDGYGAATNYVSTVRAAHALSSLLMSLPKPALIFAQEARQWADEVARTKFPHERDFVRAEWLIGAALVMEGEDLNAAATHLTEALTRCRRINLVELEPNILLVWARWHLARGNVHDSQTSAQEALTIADRCDYRLKQADIHNVLARLALDAGDREKVRKEAEIARDRAWCDGPPHCYKPALDEAQAILKELGQAN